MFVCDESEYLIRNISALTWCLTIYIACVIISIFFIKAYQRDAQGRNNSRKAPIQRSLIIPTFLFMIDGFLFSIIPIIQYIFCLAGITSDYSQFLLRRIYLILIYSIAPSLILVIFYLRLQRVFKDSRYAYPKCVFYLLYGFTGVFSIGTFIGNVLPTQYRSISLLLGTPMYLIYFVLNIVTFFLFVGGLFKVQAGLRSKSSMRNLEQQKKLNDSQRKLMETITKYVVLVSLAIITSLISFVVIIYKFVNEQYGSKMFLYSNYPQFALDYIINLVCVLLQFRFYGTNFYNKYCKCCHRCCQARLKKVAYYQMEQKLGTTMKYDQDEMGTSTTGAGAVGVGGDRKTTTTNTNTNTLRSGAMVAVTPKSLPVSPETPVTATADESSMKFPNTMTDLKSVPTASENA